MRQYLTARAEEDEQGNVHVDVVDRPTQLFYIWIKTQQGNLLGGVGVSKAF